MAGLTPDRTVRSLAEPELRLVRRRIVEYHIRRNRVAKASHDKTRKEKHRGIIYLRLQE